MIKPVKIEVIEVFLYGVIWMGVFSIPFFTQWGYPTLDWEKLLSEWLRILGFLLIFLINITFLVPRYLIPQQYKTYIGMVILLISIFTFAGFSLNSMLFPRPLTMPPMNLGSGIPMELGNGMPAPLGFKLERKTNYDSFSMIIIANIVISLLVVGSGTTFKVLGQWLITEDRRRNIEKEQLKSELVFLRHQVSPHFFMNTLNNIHSLIDIDTEDAKDAVIRLSTMMRYLLYETSQGQTSLKKEVGFIESYISLMQLRFSEHVTVELDIPSEIPDIQVPPMLFVSLLENAFKHGVSYQQKSYVSFGLDFRGNRLFCILRNSRHAKLNEVAGSYSGIGLANIRKSLDLLFGKNYLFEIQETQNEYLVNLEIPIDQSNKL